MISYPVVYEPGNLLKAFRVPIVHGMIDSATNEEVAVHKFVEKR